MKETQDVHCHRDEPTGVRSTDLEDRDRRDTDPASAEQSDAKTGEYPSGPATSVDTGDVTADFRPHETGEDTEPVADSRPEPDTAPVDSADATADAPASTNDWGATLSFLLNSRLVDLDRTVMPLADIRAERTPFIEGYEIQEVLGEGGMGIVFKARNVRLNRFEALKMIRGGAGARTHVLDRFEAEARAVAGIDHVNIVKIFEIAEHDGLPYFSLEYMSGGTLAKKIAGKPQPGVESARIVEVLCRAVSVAHQQKIIHRDLKPSNVLLAADGTLKISDFGLVKRLEDDSGQTSANAILGTPSYMAPEQARGEAYNVGPAADQYSLGAILYELLTGRPPFQGASTLDTLDMVRNKEPVPPSLLQPKIHPDVETICLKCLEKEPGRRYADVLAMAEDLRRYQAGEPIVARPISGPERLWRWCLRNRRVAALGAAVGLLLALVAAVSTTAAVMVSGRNTALHESNSALGKARTEAEERRNDAERKRVLAEAAARAATDQNRGLVEAELEMIGLLEANLRHVAALQGVREKVLDRAVKNLDVAAQTMTNLRNDLGWDPKAEERNWRLLARARQRLGELYLAQSRFKEAMEQFRQMDAIIELLATAAPEDLAAQIRLGRTQRQLGFVAVMKLGDTEGAQQFFRRAIAIDRDCLAKQPANDTYKRDLANSLGQLAASELLLGRLEQARALYDDETAVRDSFSSAQAGDWESRRERASMYEKLAELKLRMGDAAEARRDYNLCKELREQTLDEHRDSWPDIDDLAHTYNNLGKMKLTQDGNPAGASDLHRKALDLYEKRAKADAADLDTQGRVAETLYFLATCQFRLGDAPTAESNYQRCLEIRKTLAKDPAVKGMEVNLMLALARCGQHAAAAKIAEALVATPPKDSHLYFQSACGYALAAAKAGDAALVRRYTDAALDCLRKGKARGWADIVSLETDPDLEPIRKDPAFQALVGEFRKTEGPKRK